MKTINNILSAVEDRVKKAKEAHHCQDGSTPSDIQDMLNCIAVEEVPEDERGHFLERVRKIVTYYQNAEVHGLSIVRDVKYVVSFF